MSFQAAVSKLKSPVKELVASVVQEEGTLTGKVDNDQTEILNWIETVAQDDALGEDRLKVKLNLRDLKPPLHCRTWIRSLFLERTSSVII